MVYRFFRSKPYLISAVLCASLSGAFFATSVYAESLGGAVRRAVKTNPNGLAAGANARARAGELQGTRSLYLPTVEAFGELGYEDTSSNTSSRSLDPTARIGVEARITLFDGYARANQVYRNAARLDESLYNALSAASTVALNAVEAYVDVVRHRQLLVIARTNIERHRRIRGQIVQQVSGGKSPISDRYQIDERLLAAQAVTAEIKKALADAEEKYKKTIGRRPKGKMRVPGVKKLAKSASGLKHAAVSRNYALQRAGKTINAAEYALRGEEAALRPKVFLKGRVSEGNDAGGIKGSNREAFIGLQMSWQLYDGGATTARRATLYEEYTEALFRKDSLSRDIEEVAGRAWNTYTLGRERYSLLAKQEKAAGRIVSNYREEYSLSKRSLLDVLDAERARFNTGFQRISAFAAYRFAQYRMLAVQSRLVPYFKAQPAVPVRKPDYEAQVIGKPTNVFDITIDPLR